MAKTVEQVFPTKKARQLADEAVDKLPLTATMQEHLILWEETYVAAGGVLNL